MRLPNHAATIETF